jgi:hypothetical protein
VNFGGAPTGAEGLILDQNELDRLNSLDSLTLTSYSTFDLYGDVSVGGASADGKPTLQALNLLGAGLVGLNSSGQTAHVRAASILISNPAAAAFAPGGVFASGAGNGALAIRADRLVLGEGAKAIQGFSRVDVAANELIGRGTGSTDVAAGTNLAIARISGEQSASQTLTAAGQLNVATMTADRALAAVNALGAKWTLSGTEVMFDTQASLPSGALKLAAATGNLELGANAELNVAGKLVTFFDVSRPSPGGTVELASDNGNVVVQTGARVNVIGGRGWRRRQGDHTRVQWHGHHGCRQPAGFGDGGCGECGRHERRGRPFRAGCCFSERFFHAEHGTQPGRVRWRENAARAHG